MLKLYTHIIFVLCLSLSANLSLFGSNSIDEEIETILSARLQKSKLDNEIVKTPTKSKKSEECKTPEPKAPSIITSPLRRSPQKDHQKPTSIYFGKNSVIHAHDEISLHHKEEALNKINLMEQFIRLEYEKKNWSFNHLCCDIFCLLESDQKESYIFSSPIYCVKSSNSLQTSSKENNTDSYKEYYEFLVTRAGTQQETAKVANFMSDSRTKIDLSVFNQMGFMPLYLKSITKREISNHGDVLAVDTLLANPDLFFQLIKKNVFKEECRVLGFGTKFYSSLDACEACHKEVYEFVPKIRGLLSSWLDNTFFSQTWSKGYTEQTVPFYNFFYSSRPYVGKRDTTQYAIEVDSQYYKTTATYTGAPKNPDFFLHRVPLNNHLSTIHAQQETKSISFRSKKSKDERVQEILYYDDSEFVLSHVSHLEGKNLLFNN